MADTAAALVIQLSAETRAFQQEMRKASGVFDAEGRKIEQRQKKMRQTLETSFTGLGRNLGAALSAGAVLAFGRNIINIGDALADASQQLGVTTQQLQGLDYAARVSGASSEKLAQALGFLSDGLGDAQKGEGELAKFMRANNIQMGDTVDVLYDLANRTQKAATYQEKMNIATQAFGAKAGRSMVSFLNQGADGLRRLQAEAAAKGQVWDPDTLARLDQAKDSFETLEKAVVNIAAVPASEFIDDLSSFLTLLAEGKFIPALEKLGHILLPIAGAAVGGRVGGIAGAVVGGVGGIVADHLLGGHDKGGSSAPAVTPTKQRRSAVPLSAADTAKALNDAIQVREILAASADEARRSSDDVGESLRDVVREQDEALLSGAQGWSDYADIQKEVIQELAKLDISSIEARRDADIRALDVREAADSDRLTKAHATAEQLQQLAEDYAVQRVAAEETASNQIKAIRAREAGDLASVQTNGIKVSDQLRTSLVDIGLAARHGFGSLKDAALSAIDTLADMILQLYVIKPLVESIGGKSGTDIFSSILSSIPGFANGTNNAPGGMAIVGERGPELINLPKGSQVVPDISSVSRSGSAPVVNQYFNLSGAVVTDELFATVRRTANAEAQGVVAQYDRSVIPSRVRTLTGDPRRNY